MSRFPRAPGLLYSVWRRKVEHNTPFGFRVEDLLQPSSLDDLSLGMCIVSLLRTMALLHCSNVSDSPPPTPFPGATF